MLDRFNRDINYLRISVTDRCNLRCVYCMPEKGIKLMSHKDILSFEEILDVVKFGVAHGISKVRLTGGEPLVRKNISTLVRMISEQKEIKDLSMTTNGIFLDKYAKELALAGLNRVNISLDTLNEEKYRKVTRGGDINKVFEGIKAAKKYGLYPVKINVVVDKDSNEKDAEEVKEFGRKNGLEVRYIKMMSLSKGEFSIVEGGTGGDCKMCNRLRLTANGDIMPCLFSNLKFNVRKLGIERAYLSAINKKPKSGTSTDNHEFYNTGG